MQWCLMILLDEKNNWSQVFIYDLNILKKEVADV